MGLDLQSRSSSHTQIDDDTVPATLEDEGAAKGTSPLSLDRLSLFWRTFFLLALLLLGSIVAWLQTLRSLEFEPRAVQTAQQLTSQVNLSRAALIYADGIARISLLKTMQTEEGLRIMPREPTDTVIPLDADPIYHEVVQEVIKRLGPKTVIASRVNDQPGLWIGFDIESDA